MKTSTAALLLLVATVLPGCVINHGDYTVLSSRLVDTGAFELSKADRVRNVVGQDYTHIIVFFPAGKLNPSIDEAVNDALTQANGDLMTDVTVTYFAWYIPFIYGREGWRVKGDVVRTRDR